MMFPLMLFPLNDAAPHPILFATGECLDQVLRLALRLQAAPLPPTALGILAGYEMPDICDCKFCMFTSLRVYDRLGIFEGSITKWEDTKEYAYLTQN